MLLQCATLIQHLTFLGKRIQIQPFLLKLLTMLITTSFLLFFACSHYQVLSTFQLSYIIQLVQITQRIHWHVCLTSPFVSESGQPVFKQIGFIFSAVLFCHWTTLKQEVSPKPKIIMLPFINQNQVHWWMKLILHQYYQFFYLIHLPRLQKCPVSLKTCSAGPRFC